MRFFIFSLALAVIWPYAAFAGETGFILNFRPAFPEKSEEQRLFVPVTQRVPTLEGSKEALFTPKVLIEADRR